MPRKARELTAVEVRRLEHPGRGRNLTFAVGGVDGLMLQITPTGGRSWLLRCTVGAKRREIGLGGFPDISLAAARERAREIKELIWQGIDPVEQRKSVRASLIAAQRRGLTFEAAMEKYLAGKLAEFENPKHRKQWRATLDSYALPALGNMLVDDITVADIQRTLEPIWHTKTETASRLRGRIEAVLAWSTVAGHRSGDNPARWKHNLDAVLPKPTKIARVTHHAALSLDCAAEWFAAVQLRNGFASRALEFLAMTVGRSGEVRGATWSEMDLQHGIWTVPAERMKARNEHRVPLTADAVNLLRDLDRLHGFEIVFPSSRGGKLSDAALSACMKRIHAEKGGGGFLDRRSNRPAVPHGLRSTFRDWVAERTEYPRDMAEIALAHTVGSEVERAYRRGDMIEKRRAMMTTWGQFLRGESEHKLYRIGSVR
jgi:integrase